ncbi:MAG: Phage integrase [Firmicutes bacterium]|nr:Phage integrase [Bacillota bacterium]
MEKAKATRKPRKNANGEGTVFKRTRGGKTSWYAELVVGWKADGNKNVLRSPACTLKDDASTWLALRRTERSQGSLTEPSKQTVAYFMTAWMETTASHEVGASTMQLYRNMFNWYIVEPLGQVQLQQLRPQQVQELYHSLMQSGKSPRTVQLVHAVLRRAMAQATTWGLLPKNLMESVKPPKVEHKEVAVLTPDQVVQFIASAKEDRLHAMFLLAVTTGLRRGELLGLRWQDIDMDAGTLTVAQAQKKIGERIEFGTTKTRASRRTIDLPDVVLVAFKLWRREQAKERLRVGEAWVHPELVFTSTIGSPVHPKNMLDRNFRDVLERAELPRIRFHDLRHTAATLLLANGVNARVLMDVLGHSQINITLGLYGHVLREQKKEAAQKVDAFLAAAEKKAR